MLFTDGTILSMQELREHDNFVLDVASTESIDLGSKLAVAQREIGYEIQSFLTTRRASAELSHVVVNQQMRDLLALHVLSIVYRDAYNLHLNDRYLGRWKEFTRASERGSATTFSERDRRYRRRRTASRQAQLYRLPGRRACCAECTWFTPRGSTFRELSANGA